jgi:hypothetical protein
MFVASIPKNDVGKLVGEACGWGSCQPHRGLLPGPSTLATKPGITAQDSSSVHKDTAGGHNMMTMGRFSGSSIERHDCREQSDEHDTGFYDWACRPKKL